MFNKKDLAMRDPSLAALVGAVEGSDFGNDDPSFAGEFSGDFGQDGGFFAGPFFGADAAIPAPTAAEAISVWKQHKMQEAHTQRRTGLLNPNEHSTKKVERYSLTLGQDVTVGTPASFSINKSPDTELRGQRITTNVVSPGFILLSEIKVANVSVTQGDELDASQLQAASWGMQYDIPTLSPANKVTVAGENTSATPSGFSESDTYKFRLTIIGPASMAG